MGLSQERQFHITVRPVNDAPLAADLAVSLAEDGEVTVRPLQSARDVDGDALSVRVISGPAHGTLVVNADGSIGYRPAANYHGESK
jgi:hypothetical protein